MVSCRFSLKPNHWNMPAVYQSHQSNYMQTRVQPWRDLRLLHLILLSLRDLRYPTRKTNIMISVQQIVTHIRIWRVPHHWEGNHYVSPLYITRMFIIILILLINHHHHPPPPPPHHHHHSSSSSSSCSSWSRPIRIFGPSSCVLDPHLWVTLMYKYSYMSTESALPPPKKNNKRVNQHEHIV